MEWTRYTISTTEEAEDLICAMLSDLGITGIEIEDKVPVLPEENGGYFGDVVPDLGYNDHKAKVSFYVEVKERGGSGEDAEGDIPDEDELLQSVIRGLLDLAQTVDVGEGSIEIGTTADEDWINNWKQYFHQFTIDGIRIVPSWEDVLSENDEEMILHIDPGMAFGTGKHESTQLAICGIRKYLKPGMRMLDIGTGSGILGIVALKSGAEYVFGTDLDENVLPAIAENLEKNEIDASAFEYCIGDITTEPEIKAMVGTGYDIVAANIIAEILADITPAVPGHLKEGGYYITSGILQTHARVVRDAMSAAGMTIIEEIPMGEWESIIARMQTKNAALQDSSESGI